MTSAPHHSSRSSSGISSLLNLEIPGAVGPLPEPPAEPGQALWGINHGAAEDNFPLNGLQLYIPAWSAMGQGDSVSVLLDNTTVTTESIEAAEVGLRVTAFVNATRLTPGRHTLQYRVARLSQNPETSAETAVLVKLDRPGGQDQDGDTPGHSELKLTLPQEIINDGVDADAAKEGVVVTIEPYPNMTEGDTIKLSWGGEFVYHKVTAEDVGQPIEITVVEDVILKGGDSDDTGLAVTFEVYDLVDNRSEDWAAEIRIVVDTGNLRLDAPFILGAVSNVLDLDTLAGGPVTVQVVAPATREMIEQLIQSLTPEQAAQLQASMGKDRFSRLGALKSDFVVGDEIVVKLTGTTAEGQPVSHEAPPFKIEYLPQIPKIEIPNAVIRQLAQTQVVFSYRLIHEGGTESKSKGAFISVIGEAVRMAAPIALDAEQGAIDPDLATTTVQVPWDESMAAGDQLILQWIGTRPDLSIYPPELSPHNITNGEAASKLPINFTVSGVHLKAIEGGTLVLYFILAKDVSGTIVKRESARATTLNIGEPRAELPAPEVNGVVEGAIGPAYGPTKLTVPVYPNMAIDDEVHYLWRGSASGDKQDWLVVGTLTLNKPVVFDIAPEAISANDGGTVESSYWVKRVGTTHRSDSEVLTFSVGQPAVLDPPVISSIKDSKGQDIPNGGTTTETSVTLTGTASATQGVDVLDGSVSKGTPTADDAGQWTLPVSGLEAGSHVMTAKALYGGGEVSPAREFSVARTSLVMTHITDPFGQEVPEGGMTGHLTLTYTGRAYANAQLRLLDAAKEDEEGDLIATLTADASGDWTVQATSNYGQHIVWIITDAGEPSAPRRFAILPPPVQS